MGLVRNLEVNLSSRPVWLIILLGLALHLGGSWVLPLIDRDEPRFAEASREMLAHNDWVVPTFNGEPRYDKPPLIYWAEMLAYKCFGENNFTARLPTALFATGTALLIFFWARRLAKPRTALVAAVIFLTSLQVMIHAQQAVADMAMIFFVCAALWSGWESTRPEAAFLCRWWWMFYVSLALGFLAKGPVAWLPVGGLLLGRWLQPKSFVFPWGRFAAGMILTLGLVALWGIPAQIQTHGEFAKVGLGYHVFHRSFGVLDGHGAKGWEGWVKTSPFFLLTFFFSFFPWACWVPVALYRWWSRRQNDLLGWYLLIQSGLVFLVFTIVRTKLPHYTLPAFPCLALWLARTEQDGLLKDLKATWLVALMAVLMLTAATVEWTVLRPLFLAHALFEKVRPQLTPEMKIATVDYTEPSLVWEFRQVLTNQLQELPPEAAVNFMHQPGPVLLIMTTNIYAPDPGKWGTNFTVIQVHGVNFATFTKTDLTALIRSRP